ncbi:zinc finger and BTB domain-containing protein 24 [Anopheles marshallii]|uniref:zinc finger and BTB domain-containing protein 24 n=1 Tax=Anopheles marshallii TaxID=1521116 RepID=UPI00237A78C7|nr:zinc finger and BTB domain-containing protein 24 [Anopheles marshallii]
MATMNPPSYHCIVCTMTKIPFASLSKESQQKIVRNGRPMTKMPNLTSRCMNSLNLHATDWMTGCDQEHKLYCWPCLLFNTSEYDVWGKRGFSDFGRLSAARTEHTKNLSHHAKSKTLKLWIETASEMSESSGEEDVECIPELDFLNMSAAELDEEIDVKPNLEALNASIGFSRGLGVTPVVDLCEAAKDGSGVVTYLERSTILLDCENDVPSELEGQTDHSQTSNISSSAVVGRAGDNSSVDEYARIYKKGQHDTAGETIMSHTIQTGAEKYQLKWHSHYQNMNVSLSNLYKNDRYADVMLLTCNGDENYTIPAHKLILGTSSLYFANIFDKNPVPLNAVTYIVLPPDLTYRSMQILIQYMYTGESTVSTDVLNEVLRGGEILKIRGLWRNDCTKPAGNDGLHSGGNSSKEQHASVDGSSGRFVSPVTVTIPQATQAPFISPHVIPPSTGPLIHVKRDMAIDPGDVRLQTSVADGTRSRPFFTIKNQESANQDNAPQISTNESSESHRKDREKQQQIDTSATGRVVLSNTSNARNNCAGNETGEQAAIPQELNFLNVKAEPIEWSDLRVGELAMPGNGDTLDGPRNQELNKNDEASIAPKQIKTEECNSSSMTENSHSSSSSTVQPTYSPLTCELCSETFTVPGEWVRHIEGHTETSQSLPKRRRRAEESEATAETAALRCDLCGTFYVTPADWVRHVQNAHTESELAACNKRVTRTTRGQISSTSRRSPTTVPSTATLEDGTQLEKYCNVCNKSFPSYASMALHKRTHAGDKPFYCEICNKSFTVKSNVIRHMRSVHNHPGHQTASTHSDKESENSE